MIGKSEAVREAQPGELQPIKELLRPRDPAEGRDRAFDARDFHFPVQAPDLGSPAPCSDLRLKLRLITWYRNYIRAPRGTQCLRRLPAGSKWSFRSRRLRSRMSISRWSWRC